MIAAGWSPSVRLFEAGACGTPIISDRWDGIEDVLEPDEAIILADTTDDVIAALDRDASALGEAARRAVLHGHTAQARAEQLERDLEEAAVTRAPRGDLCCEQI